MDITRKKKESQRKEKVKSDGAGEKDRGRDTQRERKRDRQTDRQTERVSVLREIK